MKEEIIRMAREAGASVGKAFPDDAELTIFANCMDVYKFAELVAAAKKEECAKVVDPCCSVCAAAIRAL